jgi:hypothetical protein
MKVEIEINEPTEFFEGSSVSMRFEAVTHKINLIAESDEDAKDLKIFFKPYIERILDFIIGELKCGEWGPCIEVEAFDSERVEDGYESVTMVANNGGFSIVRHYK